MSVVVACPIAERDWALPRWFECLSAQTVRPAEILFVHSGDRGDPTWRAISEGALTHGFKVIRLHDPMDRPKPRNDRTRYKTLTRLRNTMLAAATHTSRHDHLFSLDSDIMLHDPTTIEQLLDAQHAYPVTSPLTYFHPEMEFTVNAGMFGVWPGPGADLDRLPWRRAGIDSYCVMRKTPQPIDVPMGAIMMARSVYSTVRYRWHEAGEDVGWACNLARAGFEAAWLPWLECRHCWSEQTL
jgi:hypothetical protein